MDPDGEGRRSAERAGNFLLGLLADPVTRLTLRGLIHGPRRRSQLEEGTGLSGGELAPSLELLTAIGLASRYRFSLIPRRCEYTVAMPAGTELNFVARVLEGWLSRSRPHPLDPASEPAREAVETLREAWTSGLLHALAAGPVKVAALEETLGPLPPPDMAERLARLRRTGLADLRTGPGMAGGSHVPTEWLRRAVAPLAVATRWERARLRQATPPPNREDSEALLMLGAGLLRLPPEMSGTCRMVVEFAENGVTVQGGIRVEVEGGEIVSYGPGVEAEADASATGSAIEWLRSTIEAKPEQLELGGNRRLAHALVDGLNLALFNPRFLPDY